MTQHTDILGSFRKEFSGEVLVKGDDGYDASSTTFIKKGAPAIAVRPRTTGDVAKAIAYARQAKLDISVRSGGHSNAGHSTNDGGMVIDLAHFKDVEIIDDAKHIVRLGGGARWGEVAVELAKHGLAISSGDTKSVGVGGLALAGGVGWMVRKYGLALDNLVAAEIVLADGSTVRASEDENPDLFWAIRGGGGNFGVVTHFEFTAHPAGYVYSGMAMYSMDDMRSVLTGWRDLMRSATEDLTTMALVMPANPVFADMPTAVMILFCYAVDDEAGAHAAIEPFLHLGNLVNKDIKRIPYADVLEEAHTLQDIKVVSNNAFIREFSDELIGVMVDNPGQILQIRSVGGAMNRVAPDATAFAHRDSEVMIVSPTFVAPTATAEETEKALHIWRKIAAFSHGAYINFFSENTGAELRAAYPPQTLERLAKVKKQYDPQNVFHYNFNIVPAP
jgi:FAD/FMN-containing dehydrogenase